MQRVLQVITTLYTGGAEKLLVDSIPLYKSKGIDMALLLLNGTKTPISEELQKQNVTVYSLSNGNIKSVYNPFHIFRIIPYLKKYGIIHVHLFPTLYWVALAKLLSFSNVKLIFTEHNTYNRRMKKRLWSILDKCIYKQYDKIVSITTEVDTRIKCHLSSADDRFKVINNGINLSYFFDFQEIKSINPNKTIIQVSAFRPQKDQATIIRALQYLSSNINLLLVGDGENRSKCEDLVKELNMSNRVFFLGIRMDIPQLLKSADIIVLSSHYEGLSLSCIEAMASGKPFIASDVPGLHDVVDGAGLLFPVGDEKKLAEKINSLLSDKDFYEKTAATCLERAKKYDINRMVDQYIELYKEVWR
ncbi:MAG: glycosyltransferase [Prevotellaceae bacterium]|jgi:glycosyltransferase involved in cell wall biosynthesis|nr:glycosyltransferase [Prevotellaceae bacterium]